MVKIKSLLSVNLQWKCLAFFLFTICFFFQSFCCSCQCSSPLLLSSLSLSRAPCVDQHASVCRFKTSQCIPATHPHVSKHRGRCESTHAGVLRSARVFFTFFQCAVPHTHRTHTTHRHHMHTHNTTATGKETERNREKRRDEKREEIERKRDERDITRRDRDLKNV